jgi:hypothetical protein
MRVGRVLVATRSSDGAAMGRCRRGLLQGGAGLAAVALAACG